LIDTINSITEIRSQVYHKTYCADVLTAIKSMTQTATCTNTVFHRT